MTIAFYAKLCQSLSQTDSQLNRIDRRWHAAISAMNHLLRGIPKTDMHVAYLGAMGRGTALDDPQCAYLLFEAPWEARAHYETLGNAGPSLIDDLAAVLRTKLKDCVVIPNYEGMLLRLADGHELSIRVVYALGIDGGYLSTDTPSTKGFFVQPLEHCLLFRDWDEHSNGELGDLARMLHCWRDGSELPIDDDVLDYLALKFIRQWFTKAAEIPDYNRMCIDFFQWSLEKEVSAKRAPSTEDDQADPTWVKRYIPEAELCLARLQDCEALSTSGHMERAIEGLSSLFMRPAPAEMALQPA